MDQPLAVLDRLLEVGPQPGWGSIHVARESRDFYNSRRRRDAAERAVAAFTMQGQRVAAEVEAAWGPPQFIGEPAEGGTAEWAYWRGFRWMACWRRGGALAFVAVSHEDTELPVALLLGVEAPDAEPGAAADGGGM